MEPQLSWCYFTVERISVMQRLFNIYFIVITVLYVLWRWHVMRGLG